MNLSLRFTFLGIHESKLIYESKVLLMNLRHSKFETMNLSLRFMNLRSIMGGFTIRCKLTDKKES